MPEQSQSPDISPRIKVVGVGGGGCNAVSRMFEDRIPGVEYIAVNTDAQALIRCEVPQRMKIGSTLTRGLGVGGNPDLGREAAEESRDELADALKASDMVFIAAGMGGGTGTGASPMIAEMCKELGTLTVAVVTKPFLFEGPKRMKAAEDGIHKLQEKVDTLIAIPNERLLAICDRKVAAQAAFKLADDVLHQAVQAIAEIVTMAGDINLDFADVKAIMSNAGRAWMGIGIGRGENRAVDAAKAALNCPLLDTSIEGAKGVLFNISGGSNLSLAEVHAAAQLITESVDSNATVFFGMVTDNKMEDQVRITLLATGFPVEQLSAEKDTVAQLLETVNITNGGHQDLDLPPFVRRAQQSGRKPRLPY
ncbi:MAG: cell division protein FtsZ [Chloroflexi bacterium]|nr:cell division protein FtsZ [Chloroflexota bacterium]